MARLDGGDPSDARSPRTPLFRMPPRTSSRMAPTRTCFSTRCSTRSGSSTAMGRPSRCLTWQKVRVDPGFIALAPAIAAVEKYTDGDETGHLPRELAGALAE